MEEKIEFQNKLKILQAKFTQEEMKKCTFQPYIGEKSNKVENISFDKSLDFYRKESEKWKLHNENLEKVDFKNFSI